MGGLIRREPGTGRPGGPATGLIVTYEKGKLYAKISVTFQKGVQAPDTAKGIRGRVQLNARRIGWGRGGGDRATSEKKHQIVAGMKGEEIRRKLGANQNATEPERERAGISQTKTSRKKGEGS